MSLDTCKTVGHIQNAFSFPTAEQNTDNSLLIASFAHSIEMVNDAQQHQGVNDNFGSNYFWYRHFKILNLLTTKY